MKLIITTCDLYNPHQQVNPPDGRGVIYQTPSVAKTSFGWLKKRDGSGEEKHICGECQDEGKMELPE